MKIGDLVHRSINGRKSSVFGVGVILAESGNCDNSPFYTVLWPGNGDTPSKILRFNPKKALIPVDMEDVQ